MTRAALQPRARLPTRTVRGPIRARIVTAASLAVLLLGPGAAGIAAPAAPHPSLRVVAKLYALDAEEDDVFGVSVAVDGDTAVVGAKGEGSNGEDSGAAYLFERDAAGRWEPVTKLTAPDGAAGDRFGVVAIDGDTVVVGAEEDDAGSVYLFERDAGGADRWGPVAKLTASDGAAGDRFGTAVAIDGDTVVVGAEEDDGLGTDSGAAYLFERDAGGAGKWGEVAKLAAPDGEAFDLFGTSVSISGDTAVVGASDGGPVPGYAGTGVAYLFERDVGGADRWGPVAKLTASDAGPADHFGASVAIDGDTVVVGAPAHPPLTTGAAYVFGRDAGGEGNWGEVARLAASDGKLSDQLGGSVAVDGKTIVVGADGQDDQKPEGGATYVFRREVDGDAWSQAAKLTAFDTDSFHQFGSSVAITGATVVVGARNDRSLGSPTGSTYVFEKILVDPFLTVSGSCPGEVTITGSGLTPKGTARIFGALAEGSDPVSGGVCNETPLSLAEPVRLGVVARVDDAGTISSTRTVGQASCDAFVQAVDLTSCAVSNVVAVP